MISGNLLSQYITNRSITTIGSVIIEKLQLVCPNSERMEVMENLWNEKWEITRSGPIDGSSNQQLICAVMSHFKVKH